mgnify:CR=1 FL=1
MKRGVQCRCNRRTGTTACADWGKGRQKPGTSTTFRQPTEALGQGQARRSPSLLVIPGPVSNAQIATLDTGRSLSAACSPHSYQAKTQRSGPMHTCSSLETTLYERGMAPLRGQPLSGEHTSTPPSHTQARSEPPLAAPAGALPTCREARAGGGRTPRPGCWAGRTAGGTSFHCAIYLRWVPQAPYCFCQPFLPHGSQNLHNMEHM